MYPGRNNPQKDIGAAEVPLVSVAMSSWSTEDPSLGLKAQLLSPDTFSSLLETRVDILNTEHVVLRAVQANAELLLESLPSACSSLRSA